MVEVMDGWQLVHYLVAFISPILVGLLTKQSWHPGMKAVLLALIAAVTSIGVEALDAHADGSPFALSVVFTNALVGFTIAVASHFGLWKPTGASAGAQATLVKD